MASGLLVSYAGFPVMASSLFPDNGLASLAATLRAAGHEVRVLDFNTVSTLRRLVPEPTSHALEQLLPTLAAPSAEALAELVALSERLEAELDRVAVELTETIATEVEQIDADFVGFKLWSGDGFVASAHMAGALRERFPRLSIFGGGPTVLYSEERIFDLAPAFDALADGDGEACIVGLAEVATGRRALTDVPNLILPGGERTRRELVADLDALPLPVYDPDVYPSVAGDEQIKLFLLDESRGCPMGCAFCIHQDQSGNRWRTRSPGRIRAELDDLRARFGTSGFRLAGSYTPARVLERLGADLAGAGFRFTGFGHPEGLPGDLDALAAAGCASLFLGIESFDPSDLDRLGKRLRPQRVEREVRRCIDAGIRPVLSVIVPAPGQTAESAARNRDLLLELCADGRATVATQFPGLVPRTRWWERRDAYGFELTTSEADYRRLIATYKIRHIIPPTLWEPLPYRVDGRDFHEFAAANGAFQKQLADAGVVVNVSDEMILLAQALGEPLPAFRNQQRAAFFTLNAPALGRFVSEVNRRLGTG